MVVAQSVRFFVPASCTSDSPSFVFSFSPSRYSSMMLPGLCSTDSIGDREQALLDIDLFNGR